MGWFLYDNGLSHERVKLNFEKAYFLVQFGFDFGSVPKRSGQIYLDK